MKRDAWHVMKRDAWHIMERDAGRSSREDPTARTGGDAAAEVEGRSARFRDEGRREGRADVVETRFDAQLLRVVRAGLRQRGAEVPAAPVAHVPVHAAAVRDVISTWNEWN